MIALQPDGTVNRATSSPDGVADALDAFLPTVRKIAGLLPADLLAEVRKGGVVVQYPDGRLAIVSAFPERYDPDPAFVRTPAATLLVADIIRAQEALDLHVGLAPVTAVDKLRAEISGKDAEIGALRSELQAERGARQVAEAALREPAQPQPNRGRKP